MTATTTATDYATASQEALDVLEAALDALIDAAAAEK